MIHVKVRKDTHRSRPDAEFIQISQSKSDPIYIVIDAKYYQGHLSGGTIDKTIDDSRLRGAKALIVCSEET